MKRHGASPMMGVRREAPREEDVMRRVLLISVVAFGVAMAAAVATLVVRRGNAASDTTISSNTAGASNINAMIAPPAPLPLTTPPTPAPQAVTARATRAPLPPRPAVPIPFVSVCAFSHRGPDDPIVKPNMPGTSHMHDFFGNVTTAANSTFDSLSHTGTTCSRPQDHAAYWVPTLMVDGQQVKPVGINAYYRTGRRDPSSIRPFPPGLKIVAGNSKATGPQKASVTTFGCRNMAGPPPSATALPTCPTGRGDGLTMSIHFPDCWIGEDLDSADHLSYLAYSVRGVCPDGYPVPVPALTVHVKYDIAGGPGVTLASGPFYTAHADFFNAWDEATLASLVRSCINAQVKCGPRGGGQ
jgi:hypothetical protein